MRSSIECGKVNLDKPASLVISLLFGFAISYLLFAIYYLLFAICYLLFDKLNQSTNRQTAMLSDKVNLFVR